MFLGLLLHSSIIRGYTAFGAHFFLNCFMTHGLGPAEIRDEDPVLPKTGSGALHVKLIEIFKSILNEYFR